ncbi:hypothetical protein SAMN05216436_104195 [bacterium A37T11]|nr:hypothetical protein SAMN05216436_104195 [bacterium A37T11]
MKQIHELLEKIYEENRRAAQLLEIYIRPAGKEVRMEPEHVDVAWAHRELHIGRTTFFVHVKGRLLKAVDRQGNSDYFNLQEVRNLYRRHLEERKSYRHMQPLPAVEETKKSA